MAQLDFSGIDELVERQLLAFLNQANTAKDILQLSLVNQAEQEGKNYGIGPTVASRIISKKRAIPGRRFKELSYLIEGKGI